MNNSENSIQALRNGLGAMAETLMIFFKDLIGAGFDPIQAMDLTKVFLKITLNSTFRKNKDDGDE